MQNHKDILTIPILVWINLTKDLRKSGKGVNESGAFLLGEKGSSTISSYILYENLDPQCLDKGYIHFSGAYYVPLWEHCIEKKIQVLADVHTHPTKSVLQSTYDIYNPMISQQGHIAMIIPNFAKKRFQFISNVGVYKYLGSHKWDSISKLKKVKICIL